MPDLSLYLVTDRGLARGRSTAEIVRAAVAGGVTCVQLREKNGPTRLFVEEARLVRDVLVGTGVPLIINDRVDVALAVGADGLHLGQTDMSLADARAIAPGLIIGVSVENLDQALLAQAQGADYLGLSPVFSTPTKTDTAPPLGLDGVALIRSRVSVPMVGIGGIGPGNAAQVLRAGCDGVAVVSAIVAASDPQAAARQLKTIIQRTKERS
jgi:thiamine-phosphate pyrophosphorylase